MVSESEILTSFLLDRTNIKDALPKERFKRMFPKNTPDSVIKETRQIIIKRMDRRLATVNDNIHEWEEQQKKEGGKTSVDDEEPLEGAQKEKKLKAKKATEKLSQISQLLDAEIEELESVYNSELNKLRQEISSLNDIAYPTQKEASLQEETVQDIIDSLDKLNKH